MVFFQIERQNCLMLGLFRWIYSALNIIYLCLLGEKLQLHVKSKIFNKLRKNRIEFYNRRNIL